MPKQQEWATDEALTLLRGWARDGLTFEEIAKNIGINTATLYRWRKSNSDIDTALKKGREVFDREVEDTLFKAALGHYAIDTKTEILSTGETKTITTERYIPPNVTAIIFWLKNRRPEKWRDKPPETGAGVEPPVININLEGVSPETAKKFCQ